MSLSPVFTDAKVEIESVLEKQQSDWNKGNIDSFMNGYWRSEELTFIGSSGVTKGWKATLENYKKSYPDKKTMGELKFETISLDSLSMDTYRMIGKYTLVRENDKPSGFFTLIWKNIEGNWLITSDQTCA